MAIIQICAYQALSRRVEAPEPQRVQSLFPVERPDVEFRLTFDLVDSPPDLSVAELRARRPTRGINEPRDSVLDTYAAERWPVSYRAVGTLSIPDVDMTNEFLARQLSFFRLLLWDLPGNVRNPAIPTDQRAASAGYRRAYFNEQKFDILGARRPGPVGTYYPTSISEPIGPGIACLDLRSRDRVNEHVWSPILSFPTRTTAATDMAEIERAIGAMQRHYNSYDELAAAKRHLQQGEPKAAIRAAASAVEACISHLLSRSGTKAAPVGTAFDDRVEQALAGSQMPSFRAVSPDASLRLLNLYRARNKMHEGDCYYEQDGKVIHIRAAAQAAPLVDAARTFILWCDSLV